MNFQIAPSEHTCVPTCFAIMLGVDVNELIQDLGHDGTELVMDDVPAPYCYKGFTIQEMVTYCLVKCNVYVTVFEKDELVVYGYEDKFKDVHKEYDLKVLMEKYNGIVFGMFHNKRHACVWSNGELFNPSNGMRHKLNNFDVWTFAVFSE